MTTAIRPIEWLHSLGTFLNDFFDAQCKAIESDSKIKSTPRTVSKPSASTKKTIPPQTIGKSRRSSLTLSTPLKEKSPNNTLLTEFTPKPSHLAETPFTEGRTRRMAATRADKYIDIVTRRLAEVPANGSTPKSMKLASKLISDATPNSRRNILLSSTLATTNSVQQPAATPVSVRKRNRVAKICEIFKTPLLSLATAASETKIEAGSLSPAAIDMTPSTIISKSSKLNQSTTRPPTAVSPVKSVTYTSPKLSIKISPVKVSSPIRRSQRVSPARTVENMSKLTQKPTTLNSVKLAQDITGSAVKPPPSKATVFEFVAPQSIPPSSKRPRKQFDTSIYKEESASPIVKKQAKFADSSLFPTVVVNSQTHVKIAPPQPTLTQTPLNPSTASFAPNNSVRVSNVPTNVPAIIIPLSEVRGEEVSSSEDLANHLGPASSKRTPLRVQPMRTPTRAKAVIPSLSDYSTATKIAVIEVAKSSNSTNSVAQPTVSIPTPKVEPWTTRFMQNNASATKVNTTLPSAHKSSFNINVKPVDTSKISGFSQSAGSTAAVPIVPKFPLNLASISNITKSSTSLGESASNPISNNPPLESPLSRAKRLDSENSLRETKLKPVKVEPEPVNEVKTLPNSTKPPNTLLVSSKPPNTLLVSSKLPVKPKSSTTVLPSPKIPSRLAEAFSGIDSELPPIELAGILDDEQILKNAIAGTSTESSNTLVNPKMKKQTVNSTAPVMPSTPATQLHRTAVLNSAARKIIPANPASTTNPNPTPITPKPQLASEAPFKTVTDSSSPNLPDIPSDDELDKREHMVGKENRPTWAMTPNLAVALNAQRSQRAEDVFGKVQPIKLEDFFKGSGKKFPNRSSTSNWNNNI